jgi:glycolate oxidase iron-sulfur subunit
MTEPARFRRALLAALLAKPVAPLLARIGLKPLAAMIGLAPARLPRKAPRAPGVIPAEGPRRGRVALLSGCVADVLAPHINGAAIRVLRRHGFDVVLASGEGCCGALAHHMGGQTQALDAARRNIDAWIGESEREGIDTIVTTASGCGTTIKDYAHMMRGDSAYAERAAQVSRITQDISEFLCNIKYLRYVIRPPVRVAYQPPCSLAHGQRVVAGPRDLLARAGFTVKDIPENHLCCGSAGTYNILQPDLANRLRDRKIAYIEKLKPDLIAAGNIGCITQMAAGTSIPVVHPVQLIDWATGGLVPPALQTSGRDRMRPS